jgi:hypothetical protein
VTTPPLAASPVLRAAEGTKPGTVWFWLLAFTPLLNIALLIPSTIYLGQLTNIDLTDTAALIRITASPELAVVSILNLVVTVILILFPFFDWRELERRGIPRPFHWSWSLFVFIIGSPLVYMIGRAVVAKRRTGAGLAPFWIYIALGFVDFAVTAVVLTIYLIDLFNQFSGLLLQSGNVL